MNKNNLKPEYDAALTLAWKLAKKLQSQGLEVDVTTAVRIKNMSAEQHEALTTAFECLGGLDLSLVDVDLDSAAMASDSAFEDYRDYFQRYCSGTEPK